MIPTAENRNKKPFSRLKLQKNSFLADMYSIARFVVSRYRQDQAFKVAGSLSYTSLLAIVPLFAIGLAMLAAFPAFSGIRGKIQTFLFANFLPNTTEVLQDRITQFVDAAGQLTVVGVIGLGVTAVLLLETIEDAFNTIFKVRDQRNYFSRMMVYWGLITIGPLLIGVSFSISAHVARLTEEAGVVHISAFNFILQYATPYVLTFVAFGLMYFGVPNCKVRMRDAAIGALLASLLFAALRFGFVWYLSQVHTYEVVYGALASLPIFLIWMYLSWMVILAGAVLTASLPEWQAGRILGENLDKKTAQVSLAFRVLSALSTLQKEGKHATHKRLLSILQVPDYALRQITAILIDESWVHERADGGYGLSIALDQKTFLDLLIIFDSGVCALQSSSKLLPSEKAIAVLEKAMETERAQLDVVLQDII
jgi:membrane protein